jgi:AcrR family transcriptional regulator
VAKVKRPRKPYRSPLRAEQLDATRRRILDAARALFGKRGYPDTTMDAIARESGLAVPTVYKNFGNKRRLLLDLIDMTINTRVPPEYDAVISQPTSPGRLHGLARMCVTLASGASDVISIVVSAAGSDPQLAEMMNRIAEGRRRNAALIARSLAKDRALRPGCSEGEARDVMYALAGPELYELLVIRSGWSDEQFEAWLSRTLVESLLRNAP